MSGEAVGVGAMVEPPALADGLTVRVGVDLMAIDDVRDAVDRLGERYLTRLFTRHEQACCQGPDGVVAESLAARFAAKEAVLKLLRPPEVRPHWRDIEVRRNADGSCGVRLHGDAADLAAERGVTHIGLSLSHEAGLAVAVAAGTCWDPEAGPPSSPCHDRRGDRTEDHHG